MSVWDFSLRAGLRRRNAHGHVTSAFFLWKIYGENAERPGYHVDQPARLINHYRKNPFSVATLFGEKERGLLFAPTISETPILPIQVPGSF